MELLDIRYSSEIDYTINIASITCRICLKIHIFIEIESTQDTRKYFNVQMR